MDVLFPPFCEGELSFPLEHRDSFLHSKQQFSKPFLWIQFLYFSFGFPPFQTRPNFPDPYLPDAVLPNDGAAYLLGSRLDGVLPNFPDPDLPDDLPPKLTWSLQKC